MSHTQTTTKDKSTREAGYQTMLNRITAAPHTFLDLIDRLVGLDGLPWTERSNYWQGERQAIEDALDRLANQLQADAEDEAHVPWFAEPWAVAVAGWDEVM